jgi:hypothetical protein
MALRIEDYALIGDCKTVALVGRDGSIDWLCWPRFDSAACFAALLGNADNGRWLIAPKDPVLGAERRYRPGTLVLETEFQTATGSAAVIDFMPPADGAHLVRIVVGRSGRVDFQTELVVRFNYGAAVPWVNRLDDGSINAIAGPERVVLRTPVRLHGEDLRTVGEFTVEAGQSIPFVLSYGPSFQDPPPAIDGFDALTRTEAFWREWSDRCPDFGPWTEAVKQEQRELHLSAVRQRISTPAILAVAGVMIEAVDLATGFCTMSVAALARRTPCSTKTVTKARAALTKTGLWIAGHRGVFVPVALNCNQAIDNTSRKQRSGNIKVPRLYHLSTVSAPVSLPSPVPATPRPYQADMFGCAVVDLDQYRRGLLPSEVATAIRAEMRARGVTQDELAAELGISQPQIANALAGRFGLSGDVAARLLAWLREAA